MPIADSELTDSAIFVYHGRKKFFFALTVGFTGRLFKNWLTMPSLNKRLSLDWLIEGFLDFSRLPDSSAKADF